MVSQQEYTASQPVLGAVLIKEYFFARCWFKTHHIFIFKAEPILLLQPLLIKRGAEADIYIVEWNSKKAVSKVRSPKSYRHPELDSAIRKHRTIHEATFMSAAKSAGVMTPFVHFVDPSKAEIIMEFIEGEKYQRRANAGHLLPDRSLCRTATRKQNYSRRPDDFKFCNKQKACPTRLWSFVLFRAHRRHGNRYPTYKRSIYQCTYSSQKSLSSLCRRLC